MFDAKDKEGYEADNWLNKTGLLIVHMQTGYRGVSRTHKGLYFNVTAVIQPLTVQCGPVNPLFINCVAATKSRYTRRLTHVQPLSQGSGMSTEAHMMTLERNIERVTEYWPIENTACPASVVHVAA